MGPYPPSGSVPDRTDCRSIPARGTACRSVTPKPTVKRRSDDLPGSAHSGPKAASSRQIPDARQNLNQRPYLHIARKALTEARSLLGPKVTHRGTCRGAESENLAARVRQHHRCILICRIESVATPRTYALIGMFTRYVETGPRPEGSAT